MAVARVSQCLFAAQWSVYLHGVLEACHHRKWRPGHVPIPGKKRSIVEGQPAGPGPRPANQCYTCVQTPRWVKGMHLGWINKDSCSVRVFFQKSENRDLLRLSQHTYKEERRYLIDDTFARRCARTDYHIFPFVYCANGRCLMSV